MRKQNQQQLLMKVILTYIQENDGRTNGLWKYLQAEHDDRFSYLQMRDMIQSLMLTQDIRKLEGSTRSSRYEITSSGLKKLHANG